MKKLTTLILTTFLLAGCFGGSGPTQDDLEGTTGEVSKVLIESEFVAISAEILCLPQNFPEATAEEIEDKAKEIATRQEVSAENYEDYQKEIESDPEQKTRIGYAIVGKMGEYCEMTNSADGDIPEESTDTEDADVAADQPTEESGNSAGTDTDGDDLTISQPDTMIDTVIDIPPVIE